MNLSPWHRLKPRGGQGALQTEAAGAAQAQDCIAARGAPAPPAGVQ